MWVIGGVSENGYLSDVWSSSDGVNWTQVTATAQFGSRSGHTSVVFNNKMWVIGGAKYTDLNHDAWYSEDGVDWVLAAQKYCLF